MQAAAFIQKWSKAQLSEQAASHEHFLDLCRLLGVKTPAELDPIGDTFTFEKGAKVSGPASAGSKGDRGRADVWYKGRFAWEYKRKDKHKTLEAAYQQLQQYREDLENPPLLIVCDITRTEIHTNFTGYKPEIHTILLADLAEPGNLQWHWSRYQQLRETTMKHFCSLYGYRTVLASILVVPSVQ